MSKIIERARLLRAMIEQNAEAMPDETAQHYVELFPEWKSGVVFTKEDVGRRLRQGDKLYKIRAAHTSQSDWPPETTPALYEEVSVDPEAGTLENPIDYSGNMELESGKYYTQNGEVYLCSRNSEQPVYNALSELIGLYVEKI